MRQHIYHNDKRDSRTASQAQNITNSWSWHYAMHFWCVRIKNHTLTEIILRFLFLHFFLRCAHFVFDANFFFSCKLRWHLNNLFLVLYALIQSFMTFPSSPSMDYTWPFRCHRRYYSNKIWFFISFHSNGLFHSINNRIEDNKIFLSFFRMVNSSIFG